MNDDKIKLGVLWKNVSREGNKPYLSGRVQHDSLDAAVQLLRDGGRFLILGNTKRPNKQDPDCVLFVVPEPEGGGTNRSSNTASKAPPSRPQGPQRTDARSQRAR